MKNLWKPGSLGKRESGQMKTKVGNEKRNYGIDMLRLVAMFFVVIHHILGHGGVLKSVTGFNYVVASFIQITVLCAVDCYAIISGYVCYRDNDSHHYSKYFRFWIPVFLYSIGITIYFYCVSRGSVVGGDIVKSALPVTMYRYWYASAYTALFFLMPWINLFIRKITKKELNQLVFILFVIFSFYSTFSKMFEDIFGLKDGYNFVWLLFLYIIGAWIRRNRISEKLKMRSWIILIIGCIIVTWLQNMIGPVAKGVLVSYISFTIVLIAISLVAVFSQLHLNKHIIMGVRMFAPAAFGVYLIHDHYLIREIYMQDAFAWIAGTEAWLIPVWLILCASLIFMGCLLLEKQRLILFDVLKINKVMQLLERYFNTIINKVMDRIGG